MAELRAPLSCGPGRARQSSTIDRLSITQHDVLRDGQRNCRSSSTAERSGKPIQNAGVGFRAIEASRCGASSTPETDRPTRYNASGRLRLTPHAGRRPCEMVWGVRRVSKSPSVVPVGDEDHRNYYKPDTDEGVRRGGSAVATESVSVGPVESVSLIVKSSFMFRRRSTTTPPTDDGSTSIQTTW